MDVREGMAPSGSASYYLNRGGVIGGPSSGNPSGLSPPGYRPLQNPSLSVQSSVGGSTNPPVVSTFQVDNPSPNFPHGISMSVPPSGSIGDLVKKKRGRPRKYAPEGVNMSVAPSPVPSTPSPGSTTPFGTKKKGRPPGTGWKQRLAPLGGWMNKTAGTAFTPHVIHIGIGEDIAAMILSFAQQRPRALCILSANGSVSAITMRSSTTSGGNVTYEGRFEILCLSGSYLVADNGGRNRTGGLSISVCSPDGHVIGGALGGRLIASSPVQVVACSFLYGGSKPITSTTEIIERDDKSLVVKPEEHSLSQAIATPPPREDVWPPVPQTDHPRNPQKTEVDLSRG